MKEIAKITDGKIINVLDLTQFDADAIMHSGQVFRYFRIQNGYRVVVGKNYADISTANGIGIIKSDNPQYFWNYFDFDTDYDYIKKELHKYEKLRPAIDAGGGIRILRSDFNEMVISFIISANNNIKRFTKTLNSLSEQYGDKLADGLYAFPSLEQLSRVSESDYKAIGCGYRAPYLIKAVQQLKDMDVNALAKLPDKALNKELLSIRGVGPKVCACIKLFSGCFHRLDTAPVDTWIAKALSTLNEEEKTAIMNDKYAGVAQQYIFYYLQQLHKIL